MIVDAERRSRYEKMKLNPYKYGLGILLTLYVYQELGVRHTHIIEDIWHADIK